MGCRVCGWWGYYVNMGRPVPEQVNWRVFAEILIGGRVYE